MPSPVNLYQKEMHTNLGYHTTWLPGERVNIGDIGTIENGRFRHETTLRDIGIKVETLTTPAPQILEYTSTKETKVIAGTSAEASGLFNASITFDFSEVGAFVFNAKGMELRRLKNNRQVYEDVINSYRLKKWNKNWVIIETVYVVDHAIIIVSQGSNSQLTLNASSTSSIPTISLSDAAANFSIASTKGNLIHIVGNNNLTPLYNCVKLETGLFKKTKINPVRGVDHEDEGSFTQVGIDEFLSY